MKYIKFRERYIVSDTGLIWAIKKDGLKLKKQRITPKGYKTTNIDKVPLLVHRIVMEAFKGKSDLTVDHIDGNKLNNSLDNLEYVTIQENIKRAWDNAANGNRRVFKVAFLYNGLFYENKEDIKEPYNEKEVKKIKYKEI
mgnify:FL=1